MLKKQWQNLYPGERAKISLGLVLVALALLLGLILNMLGVKP